MLKFEGLCLGILRCTNEKVLALKVLAFGPWRFSRVSVAFQFDNRFLWVFQLPKH